MSTVHVRSVRATAELTPLDDSSNYPCLLGYRLRLRSMFTRCTPEEEEEANRYLACG